MYLLSLFKTHFSNFPVINKEEMPEFKEVCIKALRESKGLHRLPERYLNESDITRLNDHLFLEKLLLICQEQENINLIKVIHQPFFYDTPEIAVLISCFWSDFIESHLLDIEDPLQIYFPHLFTELFYQPQQIAGLVIALIKNNVSIQTTLTSGILHDFFIQNSYIHEEIKTVYRLLIARQSEHPFIPVLLTRAHHLHCGLREYPKTSLDAEIHSVELEPIDLIEPDLSQQFSSFQFDNYLSVFELDFIIQILHLREQNHVYALFENWFGQQTPKTMENLYIKVLETAHPGNFQIIFNRLIKLTPPAVINTLFAEEPKLFWIFLAMAPQLISFNKSQIISLALANEVNEKNELFVAIVCKNRRFEEIQDALYFKLFQLQISKSFNLDNESKIIDDLFSYKKTRIWCKRHDQKLYLELVKSIDFFAPNFNYEAYISIRDLFYTKRFEFMLLTELGYEVKYFPSTFYDFSSLLLNRLFILNSKKNIHEWLNIITYHYIDLGHTFKTRLLQEWFNKTEHFEILMTIALYLNKELGLDVQQIIQYFESKKIDLSEVPFKSPYCLDIYLQMLEPENRLSTILEKNKKTHFSLLELTIQKPSFFNSIILNLNEEEIFKILSTLFKKQLILFQLDLKTIWPILQEKLSPTHLQTLIELKGNDNKSIIHKNLHNLELIIQIFKCLEGKELCRIICSETTQQQNSLDLALHHPETFGFLLNCLNPFQKIGLLMHEDHSGEILLERAIVIPNTLLEILKSLNEHQFIIITEIYAKDIIITHLKNHEILEYLFSSFSPKDLHALLTSYHPSENHFFYELCASPSTILLVLKHLNFKLGLNLLMADNHYLIEFICKNYPEYLEEIFEIFPGKNSAKLIQSDYFFYFILQNPELLSHYFENLSELQIKLFLNHKNTHENHWVDIMPCNHIILDIILSATSEPLALIDEDFIAKFIKDPKCLNVILEYIPPRDRKEWIFSLHEVYLQHLIKIESLFCLFRFLPTSEHLNILFWKHVKYHTMCQWLGHEFDKMLQVLPILTDECKDVINHKIIQHPEQLDSFKKTPEKINAFFQFLKPLQQLEFLTALCNYNKKEHLNLMIKNIILKFALNHPTEIHSLSPRHFTAEEIKNPLWQSIKNAKFFKDCLPALETRGTELTQLALIN